MYRLWRYYTAVYEGNWIGLIDYLKDRMPLLAHCGDYYATLLSRDSTEREIQDVLTCSEFAYLEILP